MKLFFRRRESQPRLPQIYGADYGQNVVFVTGADTAMKIAAVYRAVNLISTGIASLVFQYKRYNSALDVFVTDNSSRQCRMMNYLLSVQPNDRMKAFDMWRAAIAQVLLDGKAYIIPQMDLYGNPESFILANQGTVTYDEITNTYFVNDFLNGIVERFPAARIIVLKNFSPDGKRGESTVSYAARVLGIAATSDQETLRRFATGGRFKALVSNNHTQKGFGEYQDKELSKAADDIESALRSGKDIISLPGDNQVTNISMSSTDMQFLDSRKFTIREIARFFNVPAQKLMDDSNSVYGSAEEANLAFFNEALQPIATGIVQELTAKLLGFDRYGSYKFCYDIGNLIALNRKAQSEWNMSRLSSGMISVNDLRRENDIAPVAGGDEIYLSVQMQPLTRQQP